MNTPHNMTFLFLREREIRDSNFFSSVHFTFVAKYSEVNEIIKPI